MYTHTDKLCLPIGMCKGQVLHLEAGKVENRGSCLGDLDSGLDLDLDLAVSSE